MSGFSACVLVHPGLFNSAGLGSQERFDSEDWAASVAVLAARVWAGPDFRQDARMQPPARLIEPTGRRITKNPAQVPSPPRPDFRLHPHPLSNPHLIEPLPVA